MAFLEDRRHEPNRLGSFVSPGFYFHSKMAITKTWQPFVALLLVLGTSGAYAQAPALTEPLDTSSLSFYGFYGFYGVDQGPDIRCTAVQLKFNLYNYGAQDLTFVSTIQYIIEQTKAAVELTYLQARPTGSAKDYSIEITELSAQYVTYVVVTVELDFSASGDEAGGAFAAFLGVSESDLSEGSKGAQWYFDSAAKSGVYSIGVDFGVANADFSLLSTDENEMVAFTQSLTSAFQSAVMLSVSPSAAEDVSVEVIGLSEDGAADSNGLGVIVRAYVHFGSNEAAGAEFLSILQTNQYDLGDKWGVLSGQITVAEANDVTSERTEAAVSEEASSRRLLQNGAVGSAGSNALSVNIAAVGLGVNSIPPESIECLNPGVSSFYGFYGVAGSSEVAGSSGAAPGSSAVQAGSSGAGAFSARAGDGSSGVLGGSSGVTNSAINSEDSDFYGTTSFYGTSFYGTSFYGTSFYGEDSVVGSSSREGSSGNPTSEDLSFYGYEPSPVGPRPVAPSPDRPPSQSPMPSTPPSVDATYPVYFTTVISDYNMEDIASSEDRDAFEASYLDAVGNAINLLGITSDPDIRITGISAGSVAVDTAVVFRNEVDAQLFQEVLVQNPSLAFPAFSALGSVTILAGDNQVAAPPAGSSPPVPAAVSGGDNTPSEFCSLDKEGSCCFSPGVLDASKSCCYEAVDACGVCGGNGDSCATEFLVRVTVPADAPAGRPSVADVTARVAADIGLPISQIALVDSTEAVMSSAAGPIYSYVATVSPPSPSVQAVSDALAQLLAQPFPTNRIYISGVDAIERVGVCGNNICEIREIDMCESDCMDAMPRDSTDNTRGQDALNQPADASSAGSNTGLIAGVVVAVVGACIIAGVVYYVMVVRKKQSAAREEGLAGAQPSSPPQSTGNTV
eukprot:jgi/Tetstr1/431720/TSEL_021244.t1